MTRATTPKKKSPKPRPAPPVRPPKRGGSFFDRVAVTKEAAR
jgi:hypothetical protein